MQTISYITVRGCQQSAPTRSLSHQQLVQWTKTLFHVHYPWPSCEPLSGPDSFTSLCHFQPVTKDDFEHILLSFASSKSPGLDGISSSELKFVTQAISGSLAILFI